MKGGSDRALRAVLKRVATTSTAAEIPFAPTGGYASWARGGPERVHDIDFVLVEDDMPLALQVLEGTSVVLTIDGVRLGVAGPSGSAAVSRPAP
ncbi:MAG TPA: hypothetical protein VFE39_03845 [Pseudonocardia sp.]|nr:hypothetical protein [Pseudonocardia sp.]